MTGTTLPATLPIDLMPPMITAKTSPAITVPISQFGITTPKEALPTSCAASVMELAWIIEPVAEAENSVPRQKMTASQPQFLPNPFLM